MDDNLNTHTYDGKLDVSLLNDLYYINQLTLLEKRNKGHELLQICGDINTEALNYLNKIIDDMGTSNNIDNSHLIIINDNTSFFLSADDLICYCFELKFNPDFILELEIQLIDMNSGFCPQGRTHRLFQAIIPFLSNSVNN